MLHQFIEKCRHNQTQFSQPTSCVHIKQTFFKKEQPYVFEARGLFSPVAFLFPVGIFLTRQRSVSYHKAISTQHLINSIHHFPFTGRLFYAYGPVSLSLVSPCKLQLVLFRLFPLSLSLAITFVRGDKRTESKHAPIAHHPTWRAKGNIKY